jgi:hypothetical protein
MSMVKNETNNSRWRARMVFWPLLAAFATFLAQWRDLGLNYFHMALIAALSALIALGAVVLIRSMTRSED